MRACGPGEFLFLFFVGFRGSGGFVFCGVSEFWASLEAQLLMVARRLSHRVVAIGLFPPSSDSWHPTHSTHKFTRATASGESNLH